MVLEFWAVLSLAALLLACRACRTDRRASAPAPWNENENEGDAALQAHIAAIDRADRRARLLAPWQEPWPWWFLGPCLGFAGLCLGAGLWQWGTPDAPVLLVGGTLFLLASAFKAWAQEQARAPQARLHVRLGQLWRRVTRA